MSARPNQKKIHCLLEKLPSLCLKYLGAEQPSAGLGPSWTPSRALPSWQHRAWGAGTGLF